MEQEKREREIFGYIKEVMVVLRRSTLFFCKHSPHSPVFLNTIIIYIFSSCSYFLSTSGPVQQVKHVFSV